MQRTNGPRSAASPPAATPDLSGRTLGKYKLQEVIGRGAMGVVYRAVDLSLNRPVAVKLPVLGDDRDSELVERLAREAKAAAALTHPNIGRVYEIFAAGGGPAVAMGFVDGRMLSDVIRDDGVLAPERAAAVAADLADALSAAHAERLIHRDVKPANVMLRGDGSPVLLDFGLVWAAESAALARLTHEGTSVGSPAYMSPEQIAGEDLTPRSDIYNLGVTLFEMLTGEVPFKGTVSAVVAQTLHNDPPAVTSLRRGVPQRIADCCHRAIAKDPSARFGSAAEFGRHLRAAAEGRDPLTSDRVSSLLAAVPSATRPSGGWRCAAVVAAAVLVGLVWTGWDRSTSLPDVSKDAPAPAPAAEAVPVSITATEPPDGPRPNLEAVRRRVIAAEGDEAFETFDSDGDGLLGPHELLLHILDRADRNGDRLLDRREYETALADRGRDLFAPPGTGERPDPLEVLMNLGPPAG